MYLIRIHSMKFHSHIGVLDAEKIVGQNIQIDLTVKVDAEPKNDDLSTTVSYADFYPDIAKIVAASHADLVETLAQEIIAKIKGIDPRIVEVKVNLKKQATPVNGVFDDVEIEMED
ncbi:dihydroneopterin aldolase [Lentilactobacillus kefiri]|uniref:7,8-dihydroneopterin aldolase n=1 Tax=Lentilactobacillus kefiri TaxID=33962 RepID=A0A511DR74_LENKE|nr:dihydroneopterin aldolase [Lentilactobacillus kefiri]MCJ2160648.1 dihydroneopterin aldolase [Lentilactobacillus kefiri]MCP9367903.1 dihydroneopterin aldolase [Lentilactobacillus kefiri]MDH5107547.1 dihydroneopterin aldolase [Lentilactobacillus kefiri]MDM7491923.1 dihydroneopterin aldolase [Lentilactobacillus kefiri]PAK60156.1 dihydroneopterin aldolase [Lentilactobacillus kefiri]